MNLQTLLDSWKLVITTIISIVTATIVGYNAYLGIISNINDNKTKIEHTQADIEITQIMILKTLVRKAETNPCTVSDVEWDDYIENYTTLFDLLKKHNKIHKDAPWSPVQRIMKDDEICTK